jgi:hypothetical protein
MIYFYSRIVISGACASSGIKWGEIAQPEGELKVIVINYVVQE